MAKPPSAFLKSLLLNCNSRLPPLADASAPPYKLAITSYNKMLRAVQSEEPDMRRVLAHAHVHRTCIAQVQRDTIERIQSLDLDDEEELDGTCAATACIPATPSSHASIMPPAAVSGSMTTAFVGTSGGTARKTTTDHVEDIGHRPMQLRHPAKTASQTAAKPAHARGRSSSFVAPGVRSSAGMGSSGVGTVDGLRHVAPREAPPMETSGTPELGISLGSPTRRDAASRPLSSQALWMAAAAAG